MSTVDQLMVPRNNQTTGDSAFNMVHPGLLDSLDFPDIANMACPKPLLFFNGRQDRLLPLARVEAAYAKMRRVWSTQGADERLVTKLWETPHTFNAATQDEAFAWLDRVMAQPALTATPAGSLPGLLGVVFDDANPARPSSLVTATILPDPLP